MPTLHGAEKITRVLGDFFACFPLSFVLFVYFTSPTKKPQVDKFTMALKTVDVTFQNLDSSEISLTDVSHYYDSDPTKVVSSLRDDKKKPASFMADTTTANAQVRALPRVCLAVWLATRLALRWSAFRSGRPLP